MLEWESFIEKSQRHKDKLNQNQPDIVRRIKEKNREKVEKERQETKKRQEEPRKESGVTIQQMMNTGGVERINRQCMMTM